MSAIRNAILQRVEQFGEFSADELRRELDVSRQAIHKHVKKLTEEGILEKIGSTRGAKYIKKDGGPATTHHLRRTYAIKELEEDEVFGEVDMILNLRAQLNENAHEIVAYAFTEILNNAIDHSRSDKVLVQVALKPHDLTFVIRDYGIGIFENIKDKLKLLSHEVALQTLIKGKATTAPDRHAGEGLFFTSRNADRMNIASHRLGLLFDNKRKDVFTEMIRYLRGTQVRFVISRNTQKKLADSFDNYAGKEFDYQFSKTSVRVQLFTKDRSRYVSRSTARRLLHRLEQFQEIIIDFSGVKAIGQGFADEIFRVFLEKNTNVELKPVNACVAVRAMIRHVQSEHQKTS